MSRRLAFLAAAAILAAGPSHAQRVEIDPARRVSATSPIFARPGDLIASDISDNDAKAGPDGRAEYLYFVGRAGQTMSAQVRSDIPSLEVAFREAVFTAKTLTRGPAKDAPLTVVLPKDGYYYLVVSAQGPQRQGKYLLSFGVDGRAPPLGAGASQPAQVAPTAAIASPRYDVDPNRWTIAKPIFTRPGELIAGEISPVDVSSGVERSADSLVFQGRAGETITAQVRSDIPSLLVAIWSTRRGLSLKPLIEGPARDAPIRFVPPKDDSYEILVHTQGPQRYGKYLLSIGDAEGAPPLDPPKPPPVQVAEARPVAPPAVAPPPAAAPAATPKALSAAAPPAPPPLPKIPGVANLAAGQAVSRPAGAAGSGPEMFQFLAATGSELHLSVTGSGGLALRLYTSGGEEMVTATGDGTVRLDAIAPQDDVYFLSVLRADVTKPYRLNLTEKEVDLITAEERHGVGYEEFGDDGQVGPTSCWVDPGVRRRDLYPDGRVNETTFLGGGHGRSVTTRNGQQLATTEWSLSRDGDEIVQTFKSGEVARFHILSGRSGAYRGYLCR